MEDDYSLDKIEGDITCEYRKHEPITGSKNPLECDYLKIDIDEQPAEWQKIRDSEFNVRALFGDDQRDVSIFRYGGKLYFYVLSMGDSREPEKNGEYFVELSEEMSEYWQQIIEAVEASLLKDRASALPAKIKFIFLLFRTGLC